MSEFNKLIEGLLSLDPVKDDAEVRYLSTPAPNIVEWVTGVEYWNVPSTFEHWRQYQLLRDLFGVRCPICNSQDPEHIDCWGKSRMYLESEVLLAWNPAYKDFVCPKCGNSQRELIKDRKLTFYNEAIVIAGMRSGKSFLGAHIGGYQEHMLTALGMVGRSSLQDMFRQEKSEWFEVTFAASTATQAQQTIFAKYREMRNNSPWLNRYVRWVMEAENNQLGYGKERWAYKANDDAILDGWNKIRYNRIASDSRGIAGKTRIFASIDEWARLIDTESSRSSTELYRVLNQSLRTIRSAVSLLELPYMFGMMANVTSPIALDDPAMLKYAQAASGELKKTFYWKGATWEFNPFQPREEFAEEYAKDFVGSDRDYGANPPNAATPYIMDPVRFWKSIDHDAKPMATFRYMESTDATGKDYIGAELEHCGLDHINNHYLFVDAGLTWDAFSLVSAHPEWIPETYVREMSEANRLTVEEGFVSVYDSDNYQRVSRDNGFILPNTAESIIRTRESEELGRLNAREGANSLSGQPYEHMNEVLCTVIDFAFRIVPTQTREIWFDSIIKIVRKLKTRIRIAAVCFDQWNSEPSIQQIRSMGIQSYKVRLNPENFMSYLNLAYTGRVRMLPAAVTDRVAVKESGGLILGTLQEEMTGEGIALVELLKLSRSPDLRKFTNDSKGVTRGRDSDDVARCIIGANYLVQNSIVDDTQNTQKKKRTLKKRLAATENIMGGGFYRG